MMGDLDKGTVNLDCLEGTSGWYMVQEAECVDSLTELFEESTDSNFSNISNLIDDDEVDQGNSLALFTEQLAEDSNRVVAALKRKYTTTPPQTVSDLSPRLQAVHITPQKSSSKRRLFHDSGICEDEAQSGSEVLNNYDSLRSELLKSNNAKAVILFKFKETLGVSFSEITRSFKSSKSCSDGWCVATYCARDEVIEASKIQLQPHCDYFQLLNYGFICLYVLLFKSAKNRSTVCKLFMTMLNINELQMICEPPRTRSAAVALFLYQKSLSNVSFKFGDFPNWVKKHTQLNHEIAATAESFDLSEMIQYCFDNDYLDEPTIAYKYAQYAEVDRNAAAFLRSNQQAKFVRDACQMVRYYKRQQMREMSMSDWIWKCCDESDNDGDWKTIAQFFKYQNANFVSFLCALRNFFKGVPKKQCLVFHGPSDTGKSYFCNSLNTFLRGKVISFLNSKSQFWLSPLADAKIGLLDDATWPCWLYMDTNMRNALDGSTVCVDTKHKNHMQIKLPPLLVTTNLDVENEVTLKFLKSRLTFFHFPNPLPFNHDGSLVYTINNATWNCFFRKLSAQIDLSLKEEFEDESGRPDRAFRCTAREASDTL
jgi:hypothetical protein